MLAKHQHVAHALIKHSGGFPEVPAQGRQLRPQQLRHFQKPLCKLLDTSLNPCSLLGSGNPSLVAQCNLQNQSWCKPMPEITRGLAHE